jgi:hypothetical protein
MPSEDIDIWLETPCPDVPSALADTELIEPDAALVDKLMLAVAAGAAAAPAA